jgi:hypothetical protein
MKIDVVLVFFATMVIIRAYKPPSVSVRRLSSDPVLSFQNSDFQYNYNAAVLPLPGIDLALAARVQNIAKGAKSIYETGPSAIAVATSRNGFSNFTRITKNGM